MLMTFSYPFVVESETPNAWLMYMRDGLCSQCVMRGRHLGGVLQGRVCQCARAATSHQRLEGLNREIYSVSS